MSLLHLQLAVSIHSSPLDVVVELAIVRGQLPTRLGLVDKLPLLHLIDLGG